MQVSIKNIIVYTVLSCSLCACGKKEKELSPKEIQQKADSIARSRFPRLREQAREDLDRRLPIELKPKVDSLLKRSISNETVPVFPEDGTSEADDTLAPAGTPAKDTASKYQKRVQK